MLVDTRLALALALAASAGCARGAPPAFPSGDRWSFPLVGPLEAGPLVVPVYVQDAGPYLMVIDPDSPTTVIDDEIVKQLGVPTGPLGDLADENDTLRHVYAAEVLSLTIGDLKVGRQNYAIVKSGTLQVAGRAMRGVIGRDVIDDTLAFGFDRERGLGYLVTQEAFTPPVGATELGYDLYTRPAVIPRRMVKAQIGNAAAKVHLDLGARASQLRRGRWERAGLTPVNAAFEYRDEAGTLHRTTDGAIASRVSVGGIEVKDLVIAPYDDRRWEEQFIDGVVGLDVLRGVDVWVNWHRNRFYLRPRADRLASVTERIGRWHSELLDRCATGGCATIRMLAPTTDASAAGPGTTPVRVVLTVDREPASSNTPLELVLAAVSADGKPAAAPQLIVNLPAGAEGASTQLGAEFAGTQLRVVDASPYPRDCPRGGGCIDSIAP